MGQEPNLAHHLFLHSAWAKNAFYTYVVENKSKKEKYSWQVKINMKFKFQCTEIKSYWNTAIFICL